VELIGAAQTGAVPAPARALLTSGRLPPPLAEALGRFGLGELAASDRFDSPPVSP